MKQSKSYTSLISKIFLVALGYFAVSLFFFVKEEQSYNLYFSNESYQYSTTIIDDGNISGFKTSIDYDNTYVNDNILSENDALNLIINDSDLQKDKCTNNQIAEIENRIQNNYGIIAVNLCELDIDFALEIENVIKTIYKEFPNIRGYMTNLTLANFKTSPAPLASFNYGVVFATSSKNRGYPWVIKNQILLNSSYFLDSVVLNSSLKNASDIGYFPKNTTRYSLVAHEFGHYLSFIAINKYYKPLEKFFIRKINYSIYHDVISKYKTGVLTKKIITQAYNNYNAKNPGIYFSEDDFRASISSYAVILNSQGEYIYDETIAEAFHDYYLNHNNAKPASIEIIKELKKYLK